MPLTLSTNLPSSLSQALLPEKSPSSAASYAAFLPHKWCPLITRACEPRPLISLTGFRFSKQSLILCSRSSNSNSNLITEMGMLFTLFKEIGLDEKETEVALDKNPALKSTSFDSIRDRILSLQSLKIDGFGLYRLITKCPDVLTAMEIDSFISFILGDLEGNVEPLQFERLLSSIEPRFLVGFDRKVRLLLHHGIPKEKLANILNSVNLSKAFCFKSTEDIENTIALLNRFNSFDIIIRRPAILNYDLESQLIPRIEFLTELSGGDDDATGTVLRKLPAILSYSLEHLESHVELLRSFAGLTDEEIFMIIQVFPNVVSASRKRKLHPRLDFLIQCGLNSNDIFRFLIKAPLFLGLSFEENLAYKLSLLVKIGYAYRTKELAMAMGAVTRTSCENLQKVIGLFLSYGLTSEEIVTMSTKHPQILQYKHTSLEGKMEYLIEEMGREVEELLAFPAFLGYKLKDRIKHRYEIKKMLLGEGMSLNKLLSVSTETFSKKKKKKKKKKQENPVPHD